VGKGEKSSLSGRGVEVLTITDAVLKDKNNIPLNKAGCTGAEGDLNKQEPLEGPHPIRISSFKQFRMGVAS